MLCDPFTFVRYLFITNLYYIYYFCGTSANFLDFFNINKTAIMITTITHITEEFIYIYTYQIEILARKDIVT